MTSVMLHMEPMNQDVGSDVSNSDIDQNRLVDQEAQMELLNSKSKIQSSNEANQSLSITEADQTQWVTEVDQTQLGTIAGHTQLDTEPDKLQLVPEVQKPLVANPNVTQHFLTDQVFDSRSHAIQWCQEVGRQIMTVVVIIKSEKPMPGRKGRLVLGCERGGVFRDHKKKSDKKKEKQAREKATKKCGCPFLLRGVPLSQDRWKMKVQCGEHNHPIARPMAGHSYAGRLSSEEKQILVDMTKSGVKPKEVLSTIKQLHKDNMSTMRTIYNARANLRLRNVEGRSAMQQLMKLLLEHHYLEWHRNDEETKEVRDIIWAHPESIQLAKCFNSILMIDCTCKTNRFRMPLFEIVGVTSTGKSFTIAFVFVEAETEDHYIWALSQLKKFFDSKSLPAVFVADFEITLLNAIHSVFPESNHIISTSHISTNIMTNCKKQFETNNEFERFLEEWTNVTKSISQIEFVDRLSLFETTWGKYSVCLQYLHETWLPQKEYFVYAWTNLVKHFGNTAISRPESPLLKLTNHLGSSQENLTTCWTSMHNMIIGEIIDVKASFKKSLTSLPEEHNLPIFKELRGYISHIALDLLALEHSRSHGIGPDSSKCGCALRHTHGLPCAHEIASLVRESRSIPLTEIDPHWKKFSALATLNVHSDLDHHPEMHLLRKTWEDSTEEERRHLLKKIKEIATMPTSSNCVS